VNDVTQVCALVVSGGTGQGIIADRAYDSNAAVAHVNARGFEAVIPSRRSRRVQRALDPDKYRLRNLVERWFGRVKAFRRIATRYEKTLRSYEAFVVVAAALIALTGWPG